MSPRFLSRFKKIALLVRGHQPKLPILFLHNPKTAGTSFRYAVDRSGQIKTLVSDYGKDSHETTDWLKQLRYDSGPAKDIGARLAELDDLMLTGHFTCDRYAKFFYPNQICVFVRDPVDRILSDFFYKKRKNLTKLTLDEYIEKKPFINRQSRLLDELPAEYFGFIGLSERYSESLDCINGLFHLDLRPLVINTNPDKKVKGYEIPEELRQKIRTLNAKDYALFEKAKTLFDVRAAHIGNGRKPFYGAYTIDGHKVAGRAYRAGRDAAAPVDIWINGKKIATLMATLFNPVPFDVKQPRGGNIGFEFIFDRPITADDKVSVTARNSAESLIYVDKL